MKILMKPHYWRLGLTTVLGLATSAGTLRRVRAAEAPPFPSFCGTPRMVSAVQEITSIQELQHAVSANGATSPNYRCLEDAVANFGTEKFFGQTLPFVVKQASRWKDVFPLGNPPLLTPDSEVREVALTQEQCLVVLANAFLCAHPRTSKHIVAEEHPELPSVNFDLMFGTTFEKSERSMAAKLEMLFLYFDEMRTRMTAGKRLGGTRVVFRRQKAPPLDWNNSATPLGDVRVHPLKESIDDAKHMLRVDFANKVIGGGAVAHGAVQEEITFAVMPELIASRLLCSTMRADEAILLTGAEQFALPTGYGWQLRNGGPYADPTPLDHSGKHRASYITAVDALDFRHLPLSAQHSPEYVRRELVKFWAGVSPPGTPAQVGTGNWGCGVFKGDPQLKSLIQWAACSQAGKEMHYFPWDDTNIASELPALATTLRTRGVTVGELSRFLTTSVQPGSSVFEQARAFWGIPPLSRL